MVRRKALAPLALALAIVFTALGMWLGGHPGDLPGGLRSVFVESDSALRAQLIDAIEHDYYKSVPTTRLKQASLSGIVTALHDPYSEYFTPAETKLFNEQTVSGQFEGVGMTVTGNRSGLRVTRVFPGSPAARGGIRPGD